MVDVLSSEQPKARKEHYCDSCGGTIKKGETYSRSFCTDMSEAWTWKSHIACQKAGQILWDEGEYGADDSLRNVYDMDEEDRLIVYQNSPETFHAVWPERPAPGKPPHLKNIDNLG